MRRLGLSLCLLVAGAVILSPVIAALELYGLLGEMTVAPVAIPLVYSLCASLALTLLYFLMKG